MLTRRRATLEVEVDTPESPADEDDTDYSDQEPEQAEADEEDSDTASNSYDEKSSRNDSENHSMYVGKDGKTKWSTELPPKRKNAPNNILSETPEVRKPAETAKSALESWELFFTSDILQNITNYTNQKLKIFQAKYKRSRDCPLTDVDELKALLGLLYISGSSRLSNTPIADLWATDGTAPQFFRATMSDPRFRLLLRALRFDDMDTREIRKKKDKLAPI